MAQAVGFGGQREYTKVETRNAVIVTVTCDHCGKADEYESGDGERWASRDVAAFTWIKIDRHKPTIRLDYCSWDCLRMGIPLDEPR